LSEFNPVLACADDTAQGDSPPPADSFLSPAEEDCLLPGDGSILTLSGEEDEEKEEEETERGVTPVEEEVNQGLGGGRGEALSVSGGEDRKEGGL